MIRVLLLALVLVAGCSAGAAPPAGDLDLDLFADKPTPRRVELRKDSKVKLTVHSDKPVDVHVHGFDKLAEADRDRPARLEFTADRTGTFDVEAHPETLLAQLVVR
ncbi:hypothetical protein GCM10022243_25940 [Saccharothrix violaceirubra]|uniref:EfeO-type cupredoxin-like domain-containing protein n=1 Tax=Saccharothrix violaceirubra TaxID=413306 RepID=A0A7W7T601_9PSEU|nr:hypothetical protein [Saccharothrix violaceirubra]MBB4967213.1 hypothetical protein [Saccharothrix violaceirubra]